MKRCYWTMDLISAVAKAGYYLFVGKNNLTISEISKYTSLAVNTVSIVINGMVEKGIAERKTNLDNRRQTIVSLNEHIKSMELRYEKVSQQMNMLFYTGFIDEEKDVFENYLERIIQTLLQYTDTP